MRSPEGEERFHPHCRSLPPPGSRPLRAAAVTARSGASWLLVLLVLHACLLAFLPSHRLPTSLSLPSPLPPLLPSSLPSSTSILPEYCCLPPTPPLQTKNKPNWSCNGFTKPADDSQLFSSPAGWICKP